MLPIVGYYLGNGTASLEDFEVEDKARTIQVFMFHVC
jgi:hypothetical protein